MSQPTDATLSDSLNQLAQALEKYARSTLAMQRAAQELHTHAGQIVRNADHISGNIELPRLPVEQTA